jgi:hypothetical protein
MNAKEDGAQSLYFLSLQLTQDAAQVIVGILRDVLPPGELLIVDPLLRALRGRFQRGSLHCNIIEILICNTSVTLDVEFLTLFSLVPNLYFFHLNKRSAQLIK